MQSTAYSDTATPDTTASANSSSNLYEPVIGSKMIVSYDFTAENESELTVRRDEVLTLVLPQDSSGYTEWWLMRNESGEEGYVPASFLT